MIFSLSSESLITKILQCAKAILLPSLISTLVKESARVSIHSRDQGLTLVLLEKDIIVFILTLKT